MLETKIYNALEEIGNIGAAHAVTALSQLLEKTVMISVPRVLSVPPSQISTLCGPADSLMAGVQFHVVGDASARILLMLPRNCAMELVDHLLRNPAGSTKVLNELGNSTVRETGNIMASAYLNALSEFLAMLLLPSVPNLVFDIAGAILELAADGVEKRSGEVVLVDVSFDADGTGVRGNLLFFADASSLESMASSAEMVLR
jgi:chemotaxis protein CheC